MGINSSVNKDERLVQARLLVELLEAGREDEAAVALENLSKLREIELFQEIGKLTRDLHDALSNFHVDSRIVSFAENEIPDAQARLNHVIAMTEQSANKTLTAIEAALPLSEQLEKRAIGLKDRWDRFRSREMKVEEFRGLTVEIDEFLTWTERNATDIHKGLCDIMMAQDFQDLTGQIIRRVITMVHEVEGHLVRLIRVSGEKVAMQLPKDESKIKAEGPQIPGIGKAEVCAGQDDVDDLLSSLGF